MVRCPPRPRRDPLALPRANSVPAHQPTAACACQLPVRVPGLSRCICTRPRGVVATVPLPRATHLSLKTIACLLLTSCGSPFPCFLSSAHGAHRKGETPRRSAHRRLRRALLPKRCGFKGRRRRGPERQRLACELPSLGSCSAYPSSLCCSRRASEGGKRSGDCRIVAFVVCSFQKGIGLWVHGEAVRRYSRTRVSSECVSAVRTDKLVPLALGMSGTMYASARAR
jgi:hypothetical protein